ncbi:MFS transporter [Nocardia alni]|uniref:MFS transporter n=1 Tax=Nocardia alni TaxID=2815723 RepID=UPI001C237FF5|nr:MFS transporter [Nocardia alni]
MTTTPIEKSTIRKMYRRLIPLLFAMVFFSYLDRSNIGYGQLDMGKQLGFGPAVFGFAGSIFFVGYMVMQIPSNLILYRLGARRWISILLIAWGAVAATLAFVSGDTGLYVMRFLLGLMEAGLLPGIAIYATTWFPAAYRARAVSGYIVGGTFATVLGGPLSTSLMTYANNLFGLRGWQWMFLIEGAAAVVVGIVAVRVMTERPADAAWLTPEEKSWLAAAHEADRNSRDNSASFLRMLTDARMWSLSVLFGCVLVGIYGLMLWLPQIIKDFGHLSNIQVGFLAAVPPLLGVAGTFIVGVSSDRTGDRKKHLAAVCGLTALAIAGSAYAPSPVVAYVLLCVAGLCIYAVTPLFWSLASSFTVGAAGAATVALINCIAQFGGVIGPWSIGLVRSSTGNFALALVTIAGFLLVTTIIALAMPVRRESATALPRADSHGNFTLVADSPD